MTWYFDSHIHLSDPEYVSDMEFILKQMEFLKIKACCVSMDYDNSLQTLELAKKSNLILPFIGLIVDFDKALIIFSSNPH